MTRQEHIEMVDCVIAQNPKAVNEYRTLIKGKLKKPPKARLSYLCGQCAKMSEGLYDPVLTRQLLEQRI